MNKRRILRTGLIILLLILFFFAGMFFDYRLSGYGVMAALCFGIVFLICLFIGLKYLERKNKKTAVIIRRIVLAVLCTGLLYFIVAEVVIVSNSRSDSREADYLIVLGAGVDGRNPSLVLWNRLDATLLYLRQHPNAKAVVSGAQGPHEEITEAECMYVWLTERGIAPERIIREINARNTVQNISYSMELINSDSGKQNPSIAVVTSEFHLYRAKIIAGRNGIKEPLGVSARTSLPVIKVNYYIREAFAVTAFWVLGK